MALSKKGLDLQTRNPTAVDNSSIFGKGEMFESKRLDHSWRSRHPRQLISLNLVTMNFKIIRTNQFSTTARKYKVSIEGEEFLSNTSDLVVLFPSTDPFEKRKKVSSENKKQGNQEEELFTTFPKYKTH